MPLEFDDGIVVGTLILDETAGLLTAKSTLGGAEVPLVSPTSVKYTPAVPGNWAAPVPTEVAGALDNVASQLTIPEGAVDLFVAGQTFSTGYETLTYMIYGGSSIVGIPTSAKVIAAISSSNKTGTVRLFDTTNSTIIAESAPYSNTAYSIIDLGTLSNIPSGEAIWEIQGKISSSSQVNIVNYFQLRF